MGVLRPDPASSQEPVALETTVIATGARPADATSKRELFTEETQTVLVFERGAVIRLSAAVVDGQLLFLTNKSTGKEVVTQVLRKRAFRPTNCYVDLEFTESCPGFWGIEFPKSAPDSGATIAGKIKLGDENEGRANKPAIVPDAQDVERLRQEVAGLQSQLKSLEPVAPNADVAESPIDATPKFAALTEQEKKEEDSRLQALFAVETKLESALGPKILVPSPAKSSHSDSPKRFGKKWVAVAAGLLVAAAAGAYQFGAFGALLKKPAPFKSVSTGASSGKFDDARSERGSSAESAGLVVTSPSGEPNSAVADGAVTNNSVAGNPVSSNSAAKNSLPTASSAISDTTLASEHKVDASASSTPANSQVAAPAKSFAKPSAYSRGAAAAKVGNRGKSQPVPAATTTAPKSAPNGATNSVPSAPAPTPTGATSTPEAPAEVSTTAENYVGPKLMKSVKPVAPPEALKNYVTGNVNVDALVDSTGHIQSVTILSGPAKLRATAIKEMKQYLYEPAKRNGKPVSSHAKVTLQYWYEP